MALKVPYRVTSSHIATKRSLRVADVLLLSRDTTRLTFDRMCLMGKCEQTEHSPMGENGTYSQTCSKTAVKYKAAGATNTAGGGTKWPASRMRVLSLDSAMASSSVSLRVEYASHLSRRSY